MSINPETRRPKQDLPREHEPGELAPFRDFIADTMAFASTERLEERTAQDLLDDLAEYWNSPASFQHFLALLTTLGDRNTVGVEDILELTPEDTATNDALRERFTQYLLGKLPQELRPRWEEWLDARERSVDDLLHAVDRPDRGLVLGFHTSPRALVGDSIHIAQTDDVFRAFSEEQRADTAAKSWYSLDRRNLYGAKHPQHLYLVEGHRGAVGDEREYQRGHVISHAPTPIRCRIPLNPSVIATLGLRYGLEGTV